MIRVLVADNNMDSHKLVDDIIQINFKNVLIDRALSSNGMLTKIKGAQEQYNLLILNVEMQKEDGDVLIEQIRLMDPQLLDRLILMSNFKDNSTIGAIEMFPLVSKPFSLDHFTEVIKKTCAS
jgi:response regulator RpfG family c-di-GMP phosphodiesterase